MKKIYALFTLLTVMSLLCACTMNTPSKRVEAMFNNYITNNDNLIKDIDNNLNKENLTNEQKKLYKKIILDEYSNIKYTIKDEKVDGDDATVEVEIEVKDLYKPTKESKEYLINNPSQFYTDGIYDESKFINYKLDLMANSKDTVKYTLFINLNKKDDVWSIRNLDSIMLEKIHGIYNYTSDNN